MSKLIKNTTLIHSPFHSNVEIVGDMVFMAHVPYSMDSVTIMVSPSVEGYKEKLAENVRQVMVTRNTELTQTINFDFKSNNKHRITFDNKTYEIRLMKIDTIEQDGQKFPSFHFLTEEL